MAVGSGLSGSFGIATETTVGTPVPVTRFYEFDSESLAVKKHTVQGAGLRQGGLVRRGQRRIDVAREAAGDVSFDATTNGFGLVLKHMLGSTVTAATQLGTSALYRQIHSIGPLAGLSFTTQVVRPDTSGVLAQEAFTYPGCKITGWELSAAQGGELKTKLTIDALDEATPSNSFAPTTLSTATVVGALTITLPVSLPVGSYVAIDTGLATEIAIIGSVSGTGPCVHTLAVANGQTGAGLGIAHASGVQVAPATGLNYGTPTALQTASYNASTNLFTFTQGQVVVGGTYVTTGGLFTNSGGRVLGNIKNWTLTGKTALKTDRFQMGSALRAEQLDNGWRDYTAAVELDYMSRYAYDDYLAGAPMGLQTTFTSPTGARLQFTTPLGFLEDGSNASVSGPDILGQKLALTLLDDGVNGSIQAVYDSTDTAV